MLVPALALAAVLVAPRVAQACAACACGDPTLTVMGTEKVFAGRLRLSFEAQHRTDQVGEARVDRIELSEQRFELGAAFAPLDWLMLSARVPLVYREVTEVNLERDRRARLGDSEVRAQAHLIPRTGLSQTHVLAVHAGLELPTGSVERDEDGKLYRPELQPGSGSWDPLFGATYGLFLRPISFYVSSTLYLPTTGHDELRGGLSVRSSLAAQYDLFDELALRLAIDTRAERVSTIAGATEPDSGGFIAYVSPEIVYSPVMDLMLRAVVRIPTVDALIGEHDEGPMFVLGAAYDL